MKLAELAARGAPAPWQDRGEWRESPDPDACDRRDGLFARIARVAA